jgi:hypothetical protein
MQLPMADQAHKLYRFFDADGVLLYVGITMNPGARWDCHSKRQSLVVAYGDYDRRRVSRPLFRFGCRAGSRQDGTSAVQRSHAGTEGTAAAQAVRHA